jgi:HD domain
MNTLASWAQHLARAVL